MNRYLRDIPEEKAKITVHESGPLNLLVNRVRSVVRLINFILPFLLKVVMPNSKVYVSEKSVLS